MTTKRRARALLIGVENYTHLGPEKQLRAGRNDVLAFWKVCRRLGFAPENIRMLTSPKLEVEDIIWAEQELRTELPEYNGKTEDDIAARVENWFPPSDKAKVCLDEATRDNIMAGVGWLAERRENSNEKPVDRILTYSGHGARIEENDKTVLALCPSDLVQDQIKTYLSIDAFKEALKDVDDNMTVVLDCCFAQNAGARGIPRGAHQVATLALGASNVPVTIDASDNGPRVFCASGPNESSYQAMLGGYWYSAFTWAFTVALEQWRIVGGNGNTRHSTVSHAELLFRARMLLEALSFPQHPVLLDQRNNMPVFGQVDSEEAIAEPNAKRGIGQLTPDFIYSFQLWWEKDGVSQFIPLADVFVLGSGKTLKINGAPFTADRNLEYWWINDNALERLAGSLICLTIVAIDDYGRSYTSMENTKLLHMANADVSGNWSAPYTWVPYASKRDNTTFKSWLFELPGGPGLTRVLELYVATETNPTTNVARCFVEHVRWYKSQAEPNSLRWDTTRAYEGGSIAARPSDYQWKESF